VIGTDGEHGELVVGGDTEESVVVFDPCACEVPAVLEIRLVGRPLGSYFYMILLHTLEVQAIPYVYYLVYHQIWIRDRNAQSRLC
jgi:hypothetical protein